MKLFSKRPARRIRDYVFGSLALLIMLIWCGVWVVTRWIFTGEVWE